MPQVALPTFAVQIRFAEGADLSGWTLGYGGLGAITLGEPDTDGLYEDVIADVRSINVGYGKSRELETYRPATSTVVLDNTTRAYDPTNLSGPHVSGGVTQIKPGRRIRIKATHPTTAVQYDVFTGTIRSWGFGYRDKADAIATVSATDLMADLAGAEVTTTTTAGTSDVAAQNILDAVGIARASLQTGQSTLQATAFTNTNALSALQLVESSEQGALYGTPDGYMHFDDRHAILNETRSTTSQATFGAGNLTLTDIEIEYDSDLIKNAISITRSGGTAQTASDTTSISAYGRHSYSLTNLMLSTDAQADGMADYILAQFKEPELRIRSVTFAPQAHADLMTQALSRQLRDRITVQYAPPGGGSAISQELFIAGITHSVVAGNMQTKFVLESTTGRSGYWALDTGALDTTTALGF
jgi:hypothetical protein